MTENELKWHKRFIEVAELISTWSPDRSTKVGAVIVMNKDILAYGYNGFPSGYDPDEEDHDRPKKYLVTEHAERNAIFDAARRGISLEGSTLYQNYSPTACSDCARAIVQSGIKYMVGYYRPFPGKGVGKDYNLDISERILDSGGVTRIII